MDPDDGCVVTWSTERLIDTHFQMLNESDVSTRAALIRRVWAENGAFASPVGDARGHAAIDAQVAGFQSANPRCSGSPNESGGYPARSASSGSRSRRWAPAAPR